MPHNKQKVLVRVAPDLRRQINVLAAAQERAPYQLIEEALREYLQRHEQKRDENQAAPR